MIPNDFIQTLLARVDIVEVIDRHVQLRKAGANYSACCPFHSEKTPSFTVSPTKQFYHCFGCGAHGTAIGFLMEYGGRSFPEAVGELARDAGLEVPRTERDPGAAERREQAGELAEVLAEAVRFYRSELRNSERAIAYLKSRGLTGAIAAKFGIGYAPAGWQPLAAAFPNYEHESLERAGLVITGEGGKRYDRFRDRIMFPIQDHRGVVIGFGGRVLDTGEPKYLNSPETALFSKGRELYGLYQARAASRTAGRIVVVEGYMDVVALAQHGVDYAVATLGTATTPVHAQKLLRLTDHVVFCFDGDNAGRKAAWRALENTLPVLVDGKDARFLFLPEGEDPDDFVRQRGKAAFEQLLEQATPLSQFLLDHLVAQHPPTTAEGSAALVAAARPLLAQITAPALAALLRRRLGEATGLPDTEIRDLIGVAAVSRAAPRNPEVMPESRPARRPELRGRRTPSLVRELLQSLLLTPELSRSVPLPKPSDGSPEASALTAVVEFCAASTGPLTTPAVVQHFAGSPHSHVLAQVLATAEDHALMPEQAAEHLRAGVARYWIQARRSGLPDAPAGAPDSVEEAERLRQLELVRKALPAQGLPRGDVR